MLALVFCDVGEKYLPMEAVFGRFLRDPHPLRRPETLCPSPEASFVTTRLHKYMLKWTAQDLPRILVEASINELRLREMGNIRLRAPACTVRSHLHWQLSQGDLAAAGRRIR